MAVMANTTIKGLQVTGAYHRVDRIFGGKDEGWSALVSIHADATKQGAIEQYNVSVPYSDGVGPYPAVYSEIKALTNGEDC